MLSAAGAYPRYAAGKAPERRRTVVSAAGSRRTVARMHRGYSFLELSAPLRLAAAPGSPFLLRHPKAPPGAAGAGRFAGSPAEEQGYSSPTPPSRSTAPPQRRCRHPPPVLHTRCRLFLTQAKKSRSTFRSGIRLQIEQRHRQKRSAYPVLLNTTCTTPHKKPMPHPKTGTARLPPYMTTADRIIHGCFCTAAHRRHRHGSPVPLCPFRKRSTPPDGRCRRRAHCAYSPGCAAWSRGSADRRRYAHS